MCVCVCVCVCVMACWGMDETKKHAENVARTSCACHGEPRDRVAVRIKSAPTNRVGEGETEGERERKRDRDRDRERESRDD